MSPLVVAVVAAAAVAVVLGFTVGALVATEHGDYRTPASVGTIEETITLPHCTSELRRKGYACV